MRMGGDFVLMLSSRYCREEEDLISLGWSLFLGGGHSREEQLCFTPEGVCRTASVIQRQSPSLELIPKSRRGDNQKQRVGLACCFDGCCVHVKTKKQQNVRNL